MAAKQEKRNNFSDDYDFVNPMDYLGGTRVILIQELDEPILGAFSNFTDTPAIIICPNCHMKVMTSTRFHPGCLAWLLGATICLLGGIWGCCFIPCFLRDCMDVVHICPNCTAVVGIYKRCLW